MRWPVRFVPCLAALILALGLAGPVIAQSASTPTTEQGFVGAWRVTVMPNGQPPFANLSVYGSDGTLIASGPPVEPAPPGAPFKQIFTSAGHGVWRATGPGSDAVTFVLLESDEAGHFLGTVTVRGTNRLSADGQSWSGTYVATVADPTGKVVQTSSGTVQATRITVQMVSGTPAAGTPAA